MRGLIVVGLIISILIYIDSEILWWFFGTCLFIGSVFVYISYGVISKNVDKVYDNIRDIEDASFQIYPNSSLKRRIFVAHMQGKIGKNDYPYPSHNISTHLKNLEIDGMYDKSIVKRQYKNLAKKYHPDTYQGDLSSEEINDKFNRITDSKNYLLKELDERN